MEPHFATVLRVLTRPVRRRLRHLQGFKGRSAGPMFSLVFRGSFSADFFSTHFASPQEALRILGKLWFQTSALCGWFVQHIFRLLLIHKYSFPVPDFSKKSAKYLKLFAYDSTNLDTVCDVFTDFSIAVLLLVQYRRWGPVIIDSIL